MIRRPAAREIATLLPDLESNDDVRVETTIARLAIAGRRAAPHLLDYLKRAASPHAKAAALRALEGCGDPAALGQSLVFLDADQPTVAAAAVGAARALMTADPSSPALDRLTATTVDRTRPDVVRLAALDALADLPPRTLKPLLRTLQLDDSAALRARAAQMAVGKARPPSVTVVTQASQGDFSRPADELLLAVDEAAPILPLSVLHRLIEAVKDREGRTRAGVARAAWTKLRGRVHDRLAARDSRIGLYDLRESLEAAEEPLPPEFMKAVARIGNAEALESLATAYQRAAASLETRTGGKRVAVAQGWPATRHGESADNWRTAVLEAFQSIVRRERLTRRSPALKRALAKSKSLAELWKS